MLKTGDELDGYIVDHHIASAASAHVYKMHKKGNPTIIAALKMLHRTSSQEQARFKQENAILIALNPHESIAEAYSQIGLHPEGPYYLMEFLPISFEELGVAPHVLDTQERIAVAIRIAEGLKHAHTSGYTHRDLHTGNIMFAGRPQKGYGAKITDFGRALNHNNLLALTDASNPGWGAPYFVPPEINFRAVENSDHTRTALCDIYTLGLVTYNLFMADHGAYWYPLMGNITNYWNANSLPFDKIYLSDTLTLQDRQDHHQKWLSAIQQNQLMNTLRVTIPGEARLAARITDVIIKAVDISPSSRYQSLDDMINAMEQL